MVLTTTKWNALNSGGISFQVNVVAQEETWVTNPNAPAVIYIDASCFTYEENNDEITITGYDYETCGTDVSIPPTINNKSVTTIGQAVFENSNLTSVIIPNSVTTVGEYAFDEPIAMRFENKTCSVIESMNNYNWNTSHVYDGSNVECDQ